MRDVATFGPWIRLTKIQLLRSYPIRGDIHRAMPLIMAQCHDILL
jgi:hypothetical protein